MNSIEIFQLAVAVENFFEKSVEFHNWHPEMYNTLVKILNQTPLKLGRLG